MYSTVMTGAVHGISSYLLRVETNISNGLPAFNMVGFMSGEDVFIVLCYTKLD
jgi:magnesium chelatase family protein